jgi:hypothetical protein
VSKSVAIRLTRVQIRHLIDAVETRRTQRRIVVDHDPEHELDQPIKTPKQIELDEQLRTMLVRAQRRLDNAP